ncbi:PucR family transcriptional regulator [Thalassiella azotivora]
MENPANDPARFDPQLTTSAAGGNAENAAPTGPAGAGAEPPEVGVPVRDVLRARVLGGCVVLGGATGTGRRVRRLNVMEVPDITPWVRPGELLLTTGYPLRDAPEQLTDLVRSLHERGAAALAVKVGRYLDEVPREALDEADRLGFPVVAVPQHVSFDDVLTEVLTDLVNRQARTLARAEQVHRRLVDLVLGGGGLATVAEGLAAALDVVVLVTTPDGRVQASGGRAEDLEAVLAGPWVDATGRLRTEDVAVAVGLHGSGTGRPAVEGGGSSTGVAVVTIAAGSADHGRIAAFSRRRVLAEEDLHALERAATVCALVVTRDQAVAAVEDKYKADFLRDLLLGRTESAEQARLQAGSYGWDVDRPLVVLVLQPDEPGEDGGPGRPAGTRTVLERQTKALSGAVQPRDAAAAVCGFSTEAVALLGASSAEEAHRTVRQVVAAVRGEGGGGRRPFSVGVSRLCRGVGDLPAGYEQARTAVRVGRQVHGESAVTRFDDLGVYRLLSLVPDQGELRAFATEVLGPLAGDEPDDVDLRRTLEVLLETNLNVAETARRLHFHYNTLRYRIGKLERLLGDFTQDATLRLDLALALRVVAMRGLR